MAESERLGLPLLVPGQGQKDVTHNEALLKLEMLVQPVAQSATLQEPPVAPTDGGCWLVPAGATGAWSSKDGCIAMRVSGGWRFADPEIGWSVWVADTARLVRRNAGGWEEAKAFFEPGNAIGLPSGGNVVDAEARACIASILDRLTGLGLVEM